jgi:hypothetical protein
LVKYKELAGTETGKNTGFELPPPGAGSVTLIAAVVAKAMFEAGTVAVNLEALTKVVSSGVLFQLMTAPETKPVPFTVRVNAGPPGAAVVCCYSG